MYTQSNHKFYFTQYKKYYLGLPFFKKNIISAIKLNYSPALNGDILTLTAIHICLWLLETCS